MSEAAAQVARSLVEGLRQQVPAHVPLAGIEVELGEHVDLAPAALKAALEALLPGVEVRVTLVPALLRCLDCGAEYPADEFPCPACGSAKAEPVHGDELQIRRAWTA